MFQYIKDVRNLAEEMAGVRQDSLRLCRHDG